MRIFVDIYKMDIQNIFNIKRVLVVKLWSPLNHLDISEGRLLIFSANSFWDRPFLLIPSAIFYGKHHTSFHVLGSFRVYIAKYCIQNRCIVHIYSSFNFKLPKKKPLSSRCISLFLMASDMILDIRTTVSASFFKEELS